MRIKKFPKKPICQDGFGEIVSLTGNQLFSLGHYGAAESTMTVVLPFKLIRELVRQQLPSDKHKSMNHACLWSLSTLGVKISMSLADTYSTMFTSTFSLKTAACCGQKQCCESSEREPAKLKV